MREQEAMIQVKGLQKYFHLPVGTLHAVENVSFSIAPQKTLGVVGESGCGKSTLGRAILRLHEPTAGEVYFEGQNILNYGPGELKQLRRRMQIIFQDPFASLNPRMSVFETIAEPLLIQGLFRKRDREELRRAVQGIMDKVGLAHRLINSYPHELDGGRRQRIGVARALVLNPSFLVCDEPVSALDVSIQAQILNLMQDLQHELGLTYLFITHDLSVVKHISDEILVMYLGQVVEHAPAEMIFENPLHPYTKALLSAIPVPDPDFVQERVPLKGEVTSPINPEPGCRFASRCPQVSQACLQADPPLIQVKPGHLVACTLYQQPNDLP